MVSTVKLLHTENINNFAAKLEKVKSSYVEITTSFDRTAFKCSHSLSPD